PHRDRRARRRRRRAPARPRRPLTAPRRPLAARAASPPARASPPAPLTPRATPHPPAAATVYQFWRPRTTIYQFWRLISDITGAKSTKIDRKWEVGGRLAAHGLAGGSGLPVVAEGLQRGGGPCARNESTISGGKTQRIDGQKHDYALLDRCAP